MVWGWVGFTQRRVCMPDSLTGGDPLAGIVLAAGAGTRLAPLTRLRPKALCPVGNVPLVDLAGLPWGPPREAGDLDVVWHRGAVVDCGTPAAYLAANMAASDGEPVIGPGASVKGTLVRAVVWPGGEVRSNEVLVDAIRADDRITVLVR